MVASILKRDASQYTHTIDGRAETGAIFFDVINPATGAAFDSAPSASPEQLDEAVSAAQRAYSLWRRLSFAERSALIGEFSEAIESHADAIADVLTREQGKPLSEAKGEVMGAVHELKVLCQFEPHPEQIRADDDSRVELHYRPLGVVGAITPWNYPILMAGSKIAHALYAGDTVVLKPSPYTPLSTLLVGEVARETLPPGVVNVLAGGDELGRWMTEHQGIAAIAFTGSVATGKRVFASTAETLKRITLELGGNDPAVLLDDADLEAAALGIFESAMNNAGQACIAVKRVYAPESLYEPLIEALVKLARVHRVGDGFEQDVQMGPIQNRMQFDKVLGLIKDTRQYRGARIFEGGQTLGGPGYFVAPTIVAAPEDDMRLVAEEQFGPVLPVLKYRNIDDAVRRANNTRYGLGASIWTKDSERGAKVATQIEAGTVWINDHTRYEAEIPFGGFKESGFGRENGRLGLLSYMEPQVIYHRVGWGDRKQALNTDSKTSKANR
jgi:acyl-CoA reductase-like NAD-dependent aldehyde dehydrogenase